MAVAGRAFLLTGLTASPQLCARPGGRAIFVMLFFVFILFVLFSAILVNTLQLSINTHETFATGQIPTIHRPGNAVLQRKIAEMRWSVSLPLQGFGSFLLCSKHRHSAGEAK
jgi:hypothetical protein